MGLADGPLMNSINVQAQIRAHYVSCNDIVHTLFSRNNIMIMLFPYTRRYNVASCITQNEIKRKKKIFIIFETYDIEIYIVYYNEN